MAEQRGKPQVAHAKVSAPADSPHIIESKSFKLYLNSFTRPSWTARKRCWPCSSRFIERFRRARASGTDLQEDFGKLKMGEFDGVLLDAGSGNHAIHAFAAVLKAALDEAPWKKNSSHLLKSNCLVTANPTGAA